MHCFQFDDGRQLLKSIQHKNLLYNVGTIGAPVPVCNSYFVLHFAQICNIA